MTVPEGWRLVAYRDVTRINQNSLGRSTDPSLNIKYIDIASISQTGTIDSVTGLAFRDAPSRARRVARQGDILVSTVRPYLRAYAYIDREDPNLIASTGYAVLSPNHTVDGRFLYQTILADRFTAGLCARMKGTNYPAVTASDIGELQLALPPLPEQKKIAAILTSVDDAIQATRETIEQTKQVKKGLMQELLTKGIGHTRFKKTEIGGIPAEWQIRRVTDLAVRIIDYRGKSPPKSESGIPLITAKNIRRGYIDPEPREYISVGSYSGWMSRGIPSPGDILFTTEAPLGNVASVPGYRFALGQRALVIVPNRNIVHEVYFLHVLCSPSAQNRIKRHATGTTAKGIKQSTFRQILIPVPPVREQKKIAAILTSIDDRIQAEEDRVQELEQVKRGLMQDLLTGSVRVC